MDIKVSVIIPVYNAEKYIAHCIESLLCQTLKECEFIFVNDGSSDKSKMIIEDYKDRDKRIHLINQVNSGVSSARNSGLKFASGEYIGFVDADDYVKNEMYKTLYNNAVLDDCDIVMSNFQSQDYDKIYVTDYPFPNNKVFGRDYIEKELLPYFLKLDNLNSVCTKLFKGKLLKENNINFSNRVFLGEDCLFNMNSFSNAIRIKYIDYTGYHYRNVFGSATRNIVDKDYFGRALEVYHSELPNVYVKIMKSDQIDRLKSLKFIKNVMSIVHVYMTPTKEISLLTRMRYVKNMISNPTIKYVLRKYFDVFYKDFGTYERLITMMIKRKSIIGLYCTTYYSRYRNK